MERSLDRLGYDVERADDGVEDWPRRSRRSPR
jgi:hypothetical protein